MNTRRIIGFLTCTLLLLPNTTLLAYTVPLSEKSEISLAVEADYPPFLYTKNGVPQGISFDYSLLLAEKLEKVLLPSEPLQLQQMLDGVKDGSIDLLSDITKTPERDLYLEFSEPYLEVPAVVITNTQNTNLYWKDPQFTIGVGKGYGVVDYLKKEFPTLTYSEFSSDSKIIEAVASGIVEFGILDIGSLSYNLQQTPIASIEVIDETGFTYFLSFAVSEENKGYIPEINTAISKITPEERNAIYTEWLSQIPQKKNPYLQTNLLYFIGGIFLIFLTWILSLKFTLTKKTKALAELNKALQANIEKKEQVSNSLSLDAKNRLSELERTKKVTLNLLEDIQAEKKKIAESEAKNKAMLEGVGEGLVAIDTQGKISFVNRIFEKTFGILENEAVGKIYISLVPAFTKNGVKIPPSKRLITRALTSHEVVTTPPNEPIYYQDSHKIMFPAATTIAPITVDGEMVGVIAAIKDITKEFEIDKAKTEFVSLASHQLRTPLSSINWYTEMLLAGDAGVLSQEQKKYLDEIYQSSKRMVTLVNSLLNVSRLELGTFIIEPVPTSIHELLTSVLEELTPQISTKKLKIAYTNNPSLPIIPLDQKLFRIVLQNILSNAVKYTPENGSVTVTTSADNKLIHLSITDTGYGIPENQKDKIFQKLFRADNIRQKETEGTGLGLYLAKSILDSSGGKIWFESIENKGSTFFVDIPLVGMKKKEGTKSLS